MIKQSPVGKHINYEGLTAPVSVAELRAYRLSLPQKERIIPVLMIIASVLVFGLGGIANLAAGTKVGTIAGIVLLLVSAGVSWVMLYYFRQINKRAIRLMRFAGSNGWTYERSRSSWMHQGMIFQIGHSRKLMNIVSFQATETSPGFEIGEYTYTVGHGKNRQTHWWTYCAVDLDRNVPHMVLDSQHNNVRLFGKDLMSNLPASFKRDQVLALEGDFNKYFTLYAPVEYKRDAYYVFTPDLMALLIDTSSAYDAEVIDNKIYFYAPSSGSARLLVEPTAMYRWLQIIHAVGMKMNRQTDYYADENIGNREADTVAASGKRLKQGVSWIAIAIVALVVIINILSGFLSR